jgi:predicted nucleotidyltransferase
MTATTTLEKEIVLRLFKDFTADYNPSTISKEVQRTRVGAFKVLKALEADTIVKGKNFGKARFYSIDYNNQYALKNVETLLMEEAKPFQRWKDEFKELFKYVYVVVMFGSFARNPKVANDMDLLLVFDKKNSNKISEIIKEKNQMLIKKIHPVNQTTGDFKDNLKKKDKVIINAVKEGIVLHGYELYLEMVKDVASRK